MKKSTQYKIDQAELYEAVRLYLKTKLGIEAAQATVSVIFNPTAGTYTALADFEQDV